MEKLLCPSLLNLSDDYLKDEVQKLDRSGADIASGCHGRRLCSKLRHELQ